MSYATIMEPGAAVLVGRLRAVARRTLRNGTGGRGAAIPTVRDGGTAWEGRRGCALALPTTWDDAPLAVSDDTSPPPAVLESNFAFQELITRGAEAEIWRAERRSDAQTCVVKLYFPGIAPDASVLSSIAAKPHAHFPVLYAQGNAEGRYYEAMEYLSYGSLREQLRFGALDLVSCFHLLRELADALDVLHARGIHGTAVVHGDIKPDNILLRSTVPPNYVLCDFGVSFLAESPLSGARSGFGRTPYYSAPESLTGQSSIAADFWALGITLREVLGGADPFSGLSAEAIRQRIVAEWQPDCPPGLSSSWKRLLNGLLQRTPHLRWGGADVQRWLIAYAGECSASAADMVMPASEDRFFGSSRALALYLAQHWETAAPLMEAGREDTWMDRAVRAVAPEVELAALRAQAATSTDQRLLRLIYRLAPDLPPVWKTWSVGAADVAALAALAIRGGRESQLVVHDLCTQDVLGELGRASAEPELARLAAGWDRAWDDYRRTREVLRRLGGPVDQLPSDDVALPSLLRAVMDGLPDAEQAGASRHTQFCCPWTIPLTQRRADDLGAGLIATLLLRQGLDQYPDHFRQSIDYAESELMVSETTAHWGWNPPVIAFSETHTPIWFTVCDKRVQIGNRVHLSWSVSPTAYVYLLGVGRVAGNGDMERSDGQVARYGLLAINATGFSVSRLPPIEFPEQALCDQEVLCAEAVPARRLNHGNLRARAAYARTPLSACALNSRLGANTGLTGDDLPRARTLTTRRTQMGPRSGLKLTRDDLPRARTLITRRTQVGPRSGPEDLPPRVYRNLSHKGSADERTTGGSLPPTHIGR